MRLFDYQAGRGNIFDAGSVASIAADTFVTERTAFAHRFEQIDWSVTRAADPGTVAAGPDVPGDSTTTTSLPIGGSINNTLDIAGDTDWFRVTLTAGQAYTIDLVGDSSNGTPVSDTFLRLFDTDGLTQLFSDDDGGTGLFSKLVFEVDTSGTYFVSAESFAGFYTGDYTLSIEESISDTIADDVTTTTTLSVTTPVFSNIETSNDLDFMRLSVTEGETYTVSMLGSRGGQLSQIADAWVQLYDYDSATDQLTYLGAAYNFNGGATGNFTADADGELYIVARGIESTGSYVVTLSDAVNEDAAAGDTTTTESIALGSSIAANLDVFGDTDWYAVTLTAGERYEIAATPATVALDGMEVGVYGVPDAVLKQALEAGFEFPACACPGCVSQTIETFNEENGLIGLNAISDVDVRVRDADGNIVFNAAGVALESLSGILQFTAEESGEFFIEVFDEGTLTSGGYNLSFDTFVPPTPTEAIDWGTQLASTTVDVYFAASGETADGGFTSNKNFTASEIAAFQAAFDMFESFTDLEFNIVNTMAAADFVFVLDSTLGGLGRMGPPGFGSGEGVGVFQWDTSSWSTDGLTPGGDGFNTIIHEIGHGLGLAHPHDNGGTSAVLEGVTGAFNSYGVTGLNQSIYTMMSYNRGFPLGQGSGNDFFGVNASPMAVDIAVLQSKYNADMTHATGDDTYNLPDQSGVGIGWVAIWDAGGNDRIRYDGADDALIDLRDATLLAEQGGGGYASFAGDVLGGFTIANGVVIESALGDAGNDILVGNQADNDLAGRGGDDIIIATGGSDTINGGANFDMVSYVYSDKRVVINLDSVTRSGAAAGTALETDDGSVDTLTAIEFAMGGTASDILYGNDRRNTLIGNEGDDTLNGRGGRDTLDGGAGNDALIGSGGIDTADYSRDTAGITADMSTGTVLDGFGGTDTLTSVENLIGSAFDDLVTGDDINNRIFLGDGADTANGGGGNDSIYGGDGNDILNGELGSDRLYGEGGDDILNGGDATDIMDGGLGNDTLNGGAGNDKMYGREGADTLNGGDGLDFMFGQEGNDILIGGAERDYMYGGDGDDRLQGDTGDDLLYGNDGIDTAVFSGNFADYAINVRANGNLTVEDLVGTEGLDRLYKIEFLEFADGVYEVATL